MSGQKGHARRAGTTRDTPAGGQAKHRRRRRRWPLWIGAALLILTGLAWLAPYLLSTPAGTRLLMATISPYLDGRLQINALSLAWLSPCRAEGLTLLDPQGRTVLTVKRLQYRPGLWHAIWNREDFEHLRLESPCATLYLPAGQAKAQPRKTSPPGPRPQQVASWQARPTARRPQSPAGRDQKRQAETAPRTLAQARGKVVVRAGSVRLVRADGTELELTDINGQVKVATLNRITGHLVTTLPDGAEVMGEFELHNLVRGGQVDLKAASGTAEVRTDGLADLAPLATLLGQRFVRGKAELEVQAEYEGGQLTAEFQTRLRQFAAPHSAQAAVKPLDLAATGKLTVRERTASGEVTLTGRPGLLRARGRLRYSPRPKRPELEELASALMTGQALTLPEFSLSASGRVDLAALAEAAPTLLRLRRDVQLTGGALRIDNVSITGGARPSARGGIGVTGLTARRAGRTITLQPARADFDLLLKPGKGLIVRQALLRADFARLEASGTPRSTHATFSADLGRVHAQVGEILDLGDLKLGGELSGSLTLSRPTDARVDFDLRADCTAVDVQLGSRSFQAPRAMMIGGGHLDIHEQEVRRVTVTRGQVRFDPALDAAGRGHYDVATGGFQATADVRRVDLGYLSERIPAARSRLGGRVAGTITNLRATVRRPKAGAGITSTGEAVLADLAVHGRALPDRKINLSWSDLRLNVEKHLGAGKVRVKGVLLDIAASVRASDDGAARSLTATLEADLAGCLATIRPWLGEAGPKPPKLAGRAYLRGSCRTRAGQTDFEATALIQDRSRAVLVARGKGIHHAHNRALKAEVELEKADLAHLGLSVPLPGLRSRAVISGFLSAKTRLSRAAGGGAITATGAASGRQLAVDGKPLGDGQAEVRWDDVRLVPTKSELSARSLRLTSAMANANLNDVRLRWGKAPSAEATVELSADLAKCSLALAPLLETNRPPSPEGLLALKGKLSSAAGKVHFQAGARITATDAGRRPGGMLFQATGNGWLAPKGKAFSAVLDLKRVELAYAARQVQALVSERLEGWEGTARAEARLARTDVRGPIVTTGQVTITNLRIDGRRVSGKDVALAWTDLRFWPAARRLTATSASLDSTPAALTARAVRCSFGERFDAAGRIELRADIAGCLAVAGPIAKWKAPPPVAGRLAFSGEARSAGRTITCRGTGAVNDLRYGTGRKAFRESRVDFAIAADIDARSEAIALRRVQVGSGLLTATAAGTVRQFRTWRECYLRGHYQADWRQIMALLHSRRPGLAGKVDFEGRSAGDFQLAGRMHDAKANPPWRGLKGSATVTWRGARLLGIVLGPAELSPSLADGKLTLPVAVITARQAGQPAPYRRGPTTQPGRDQVPAEGKVRLGGVVDFTAADPTLHIERLEALEEVPLSVEVGELLLSRLNPLFAKVNVARLDGRASLVLYRPARQLIPAAGVWIDRFALPLSKAIKHRGTGAGELTLSTVTLQPRGLGGALLRRLLELGGIDPARRQPMRVTGAKFFIAKGRIWYKDRDFTIHFGEEFDLQFSGSVGFDETLDLTVWVPVRSALLKRMKVHGPVATYARYLEGEHVGIPIRGTRQRPRLELRAVDVRPLVRKAAAAIVADQLRRRFQGRPRRPGPASRPATAPAPTTRPAEQLIDDLLELLRGAGRQRER
ncbi:MAG: hypothetical protein B1H04_01610 [Planctomycetales bacterium 4484_123]|nr:MAG: hypothetical protein B1H04_01610 [Planctomycetales bacterium 4484_123]